MPPCRPLLVPFVVAAVACGAACSSSPPATAQPQQASDAGADAPALDASEDAAPDAPPADAGGDGEAEAESGSSSFAHCTGDGPVPAWVDASAAGASLVASCPGFSLRLSALVEGVLRLQYVRQGDSPVARSWAVAGSPELDTNVAVAGTPDGVELCSATMVVQVATDGCRIEVRDPQGSVLASDGAQGGWSEHTTQLDGADVTVASVLRQTPADERFYGFGEKTGPLQKRGQHMTFWNTDAYDSAYGGYAPDADPLYLSVPFFLGLRADTAYGVFTDSARRTEIDVAQSATDQIRVDVFGGSIDQYLVAGPSMREVLGRYTALTGRIPLPPRWALGYHQCRWGYAPDSHVAWIGQQFRDRAIPADALWLDIQHMDGFRTFTWDPSTFPDPQGLLDGLAGQGFKVTVIADPGIKQDPGWAVYDSGLAGEHFLRKPGGELFVGTVWPGPAVFPDFTSASARGWWGDNVQSLVDLGVRGVWLDVNEPTVFPESGGGSVPGDLPVDGDGTPTTMAEAHNAYALLEARATREGMLAAAPDRRPFILSRAGYAGIQRVAAVWTGDSPSSWTSLRQTLPMLLNLGLSGVPFVGSDVGGYSGGATPELFARWMSVGSISPFFRGHVTNGVADQEPWAFGTEVEDISRNMIGQRYELLPYLYSLFAHAAETGEPVLRPMVYEFQGDPAVREIDDQAMLGPFIMVAPVLDENATSRSVTFPAGRWFEATSGAVIEGPAVVDVPVTLAALPMYIREGAIIPRIDRMMWTDQAPITTLYLDLYPSAQPSEFTLYEDEGDGFGYDSQQRYSRVVYRLESTALGARLDIVPREGTYSPPSRRFIVRVRRVDHPGAVGWSGAHLAHLPDYESVMSGGPGYFYDERDLALLASLPEVPGTSLFFGYDSTLTNPAPDVLVSFEVTLPPGTPTTTQIHISTSSSGWTQIPLQWGSQPDTAVGEVSLPRGQWFEYKYTRGDWDTVEKWPACEEAENRYGFGAAHPVRKDTVFGWRDWCP